MTAATIKMLENLQTFFIGLDYKQPGKGWLEKARTIGKATKELSYRLNKPQIVKNGVTCCGTCGHRVKDGYTYCNHCGQRQGREAKADGEPR